MTTPIDEKTMKALLLASPKTNTDHRNLSRVFCYGDFYAATTGNYALIAPTKGERAEGIGKLRGDVEHALKVARVGDGVSFSGDSVVVGGVSFPGTTYHDAPSIPQLVSAADQTRANGRRQRFDPKILKAVIDAAVRVGADSIDIYMPEFPTDMAVFDANNKEETEPNLVALVMPKRY